MICLFGMDGSGKTTCAKALQRELEARGCISEYSRYGFRLFNIFKSAFNRGPNIHKSPATVEPSTLSFFGAFIIVLSFLDALAYRVPGARRHKNSVVVSDRYLYDHAVNWLYKWPKWITQLYLSILDPPEVTVLLDVPAEIAHMRRPEETLEHYERTREKYLRVMSLIRFKKVTISSEGAVDNTTKLILCAIENLAPKVAQELLSER